MIVVEHEPGALLVGSVEGLRPGAWIRHVGDVLRTHAFGVARRCTSRGDPLVSRAVADPRSTAAMEMEGGPDMWWCPELPPGCTASPRAGQGFRLCTAPAAGRQTSPAAGY